MAGSLLFLGMALLALAAGLAARRRIRRQTREQRLSEEMIRRIEREGEVRYESREPLDLDAIREEEDGFWEQTWDEPEPL